MNKKVKKAKEAEVKKVNGFTQSMNDFDYNFVEQYQEEQIADQQILDELVEEPTEISAEPVKVEEPESPIVEEPEEDVAAKQLAASVVNPPFQADVSLDEVEEMFAKLKNKPVSAVAKVSNLDGYLVITLIIISRFNNMSDNKTFADMELVSYITRAMSGDNVSMDDYGHEPHIIEYTEADPQIELLQFFLRSKYKCRISSPFTPRNAPSKLCFCVDVTIADRMTFHFYLEKTEEINKIITNA